MTAAGLTPLHHRLNVPGVRPRPSALHDEAQEFHRGGVKRTFLFLDEQVVLQQALDDAADMLDVLLHSPGKKQDVVQVQNDEHVQHVHQDIIHHCLEDGWGIGETKRHDKVLVVLLNAVFHSSPSRI